MTHTDWHGCYRGGWRGLIADDAFSHPAKYARGLIARIIDHALAEGWVEPGDVVGDPFGGVGLGGIVCAYKGLAWVGCELEPRFVELADKNFDLHRKSWGVFGNPHPVIVQGDSREFAEIVGRVDVIATSPPYQETGLGIRATTGVHWGREDPAKSKAREQANKAVELDSYGTTPGQIGALKSGKLGAVDLIATSPPYAETGTANAVGGNQIDPKLLAESLARKARGEKGIDLGKTGQREDGKQYGATNGQIGQEKGESYFDAMRQVYQQCHLALKPGGYMIVVIKDYIKGGKRVPLCDDTAKLLEACGFTIVERIRAWLVEETVHAGLWGDVVETVERKSFFRRLAEKNGAPPIDYEQVVVARAADAEVK